MMGVLPDWMIQRDIKIDNMAEGIKREGVISFGVTSYGYDCRIGYVFDVFSPIHATEIDPKNFDKRALERIDLTPTYNHTWECKEWDKGEKKGDQCVNCGAWKGTPSEHSFQCPTVKPNFIRVPLHSFVLGESIETFHIPRDVLCIVLGKSTYARCGLIVNVTPGEPEWVGKWTIEISNTTDLPARIYAGEGIMQCIFLRTDGRAELTRHRVAGILKSMGNFDHAAQELENVSSNVMIATTCRKSYADKSGKYQNQSGLTMPTVDKHSEHPEGK